MAPRLYWQLNPVRAFASLTHSMLPADVNVTAYAARMEDNFFHQTHYFLLSGSEQSLRAFATNSGLVESEDARYMLPTHLFNQTLAAADTIAGYETEADKGRDRWFWILSGGDRAIYAY